MGKHLSANELPNRIRELREARGLLLPQLGEMVGLTGPMIGHLERGRRDLKFPHMKAIARALGVAVDELLNPEDRSLFLTQDARELVGNYLQLDAKDRRAVRSLADNLVAYTPEPAEETDEAADRRRA